MRLFARRLAITAIISSALFVLSSAASAATSTYFWDDNNTTPGSGNGGGSWSGTNWNTDSTGGSSGTISAWQSGGNAVFSAGTDGVGSLTITVTGSPSIGDLTVKNGGITLSGSGTFALASSSTWTANAGTTLVVQPGISTASLFTIGGSGNSTYAGVITGGANIVKSGSALATLAAANAFQGTTTISGGTLDLANGNALQLSTLVAPSPGSLIFDQSVSSRVFNVGGLSGTGNIALQNSAGTPASISLTVGANNNSTTYTGVLSSSGALTKFGVGSLTLITTNTYTGGTTISGGTIQLGDGTSGHDGKLSSSGGILDNANLAFNLYGSQSYGGALAGVGNLIKTGTGTLTLTGSTSFSGNTTISAGTLTLSNSAALQLSTLTVPTSGLVFDQSVTSNAFVVGNLSGSGNMALQNSASTPAAISLTVGGNNSTAEYFGVLSGAGSLTVIGNGTLILANTSTYSGLTTVASGALQFGDGTSGHDGLLSGSGSIVNNSAVTFDLFGSETYAGSISGSGALAMSGTGFLALTGTNSFSGGATVSAGTLQIGNGTVGHDGALSGTGSITNYGSLVSNVAGMQTIPASISGTGSLTKIGSGILALTAANFYTGITTISNGTLQLGDGTLGDDGMLSGTGGVVNNAVFAFRLAGSQNYADVISGSGALVKLGSGSLALSGTGNSYSGGTTITGGVLEATNTGALPLYSMTSKLSIGASGTLALSAGTAAWTAISIGSLLSANSGGFASGSTLGIDTSNGSFFYGGTIPGSLGLAKLGPNSLILTGSNTYSEVTTISGGTVQLGDGTSGHDGVVSATGGIIDSAALAYNLYGNESYAGTISGPGTLTKLGTGTLVLQGSNTFSGITTISNGTLTLANSAALQMSTLVAPTAGTLVFDTTVANHVFNVGALSGSGNLALQNNSAVAITLNAGGNQSNTVYSGTLSGPGGFIKSGSGLLALTSSNTFTGGTTISGGTLQLGNGLSGRDGSLLSSGSIADNGTLSFDLVGSQTYSGTISGSGSVLLAAGSLTLPPAAVLSTTAGNLHVGERAGATLTISNSSSVNVASLVVNNQSTASGGTGYLNLQGGTLNVSGPVTVGNARMDTSASDTNSLVTQTGGTLSAGGAMTIGVIGAAQSIYNASGGRFSAAGGLAVGAQGNGVLNISGSGNVAITGTQTLSIGGNLTGETGGTVSLSGGTLTIGGDTILGNTGVGTLVRSGGVLSASGNLIAAGAGTLVLNGSASSVATTFSGQIANNGTGTLVVVPVNNLMSFGGSEALTFGQSSALTSGILGPWTVCEASGTNSAGDYLTLTATGGGYSLGTASYTGTSFASSSGTSVISISGSNTITSETSAYTAKFGGGSTTTVSGSLSLAGGGMILNGATLSGSGLVRFAQRGTLLGVPYWNSITGMVFVGSNTASSIAVPLTTSQGMVKFGPGTLVLSGNNSGLDGGIVVTSGVLSAQSSSAIGPGGVGNDVLVAFGAELDVQNNIALPNVEVSLCGTGIGNAGALHNISGTNSLAGVLNLTGNLQIGTDSGNLLLGPLQGSYNLTKTGTGTLALAADSSSIFSGAISVLQGTLDVSNSGALGNPSGGGVITISPTATLSIHGGITVPQSLAISSSGVGGAGVLLNTQGDNEVSGAVAMTGNSQIATNADSLLTLSGPISGNYSITKTGSGTLSLTNWSNSFGGSLSVPAGTLSIPTMNNAGSAGPLGSGTTAINLAASGGSAMLDYSGFGDTSNRAIAIASGGTAAIQVDYPNADLTLGGAVTGSGALIKTGYGELTIGGSASYSGPTYVSQGVLAIGLTGSLLNSSTISLSPGTLLQLTNSGTSQLSSSATIALNGSELTFSGNAASSTSGQIVGTLALGVGENDIVLGVTNTGSHLPYLKFAGLASHVIGASVVFAASGAQAQFQSGGNTNGIIGGYAIYNGADFATLSSGTVQGYSSYVTGNLGTLSAASTMNVEPTGLQTSLTGAMTINSINLVGFTGVSNKAGYTLTLASGGLIANTAGGIRGGTLKGSASGELTVYLAQNINVSSTIADNGGATALVIAGPGTMTLTGSASYTGDTYLNDGGLILIPPANATYAGAIHGPGNLTKSGTATLTLSGTSDFSGTTTITGGGLRVNGLLSPNSEVTLQSSAVLSGSGTIGGDVTATGGSIALSSGGNIAGSATVDSGTLTIGAPGIGNYFSSTGGLNVTGGGVLLVSPSATMYGNVNISSSAQSNFSGNMSGTGSVLTLDADSGGTLTLSNTASSTYGGVVVENGTLKLATTAVLGNNPLSINGGELNLGGWSAYTLKTLSGSGGMVDPGSGTLNLSFAPPSGVSSTYGGSIVDGDGLISLLKTGTGTTVLSGSNTYGGGTTISDGTLVLASPNAVLTGSSVTVGDAGSFAPIIPDTPIPDTPNTEIPMAASVSPVPEPTTLALLAAGAFAIIVVALRRRIGG